MSIHNQSHISVRAKYTRNETKKYKAVQCISRLANLDCIYTKSWQHSQYLHRVDSYQHSVMSLTVGIT